MSIILILIFFIIVIFLILIYNLTKKNRSPMNVKPSLVLGGGFETEPEQLAVELQTQISIPPPLQFKDPRVFTSPFYNQPITSFYNLDSYPWLRSFFSPFKDELLNPNNQVLLDNLKNGGNYGAATYGEIYSHIAKGNDMTDHLLKNTFKFTYSSFLENSILPQNVKVKAVDYYHYDIQNLLAAGASATISFSNAPSFRYPFEVIMLIVAENEYPTDKFYVWGVMGQILILFLSTFIIKYEVEQCVQTLKSIKKMRDSFIGLYSYLDIEDKIGSEQLFRTYKTRLQIINQNERENIFHKNVIKKGLITLQKEGIQLEKILESEKNTENLDQLTCIQNRIKNRIRSL